MVRQDNRFVVLCPANAVKEQKRDVDNANNKGGCNLLLNRVYFALWGMVLSYTMQNGIEKCVFDCENGGSAHPKYKAVRTSSRCSPAAPFLDVRPLDTTKMRERRAGTDAETEPAREV